MLCYGLLCLIMDTNKKKLPYSVEEVLKSAREEEPYNLKLLRGWNRSQLSLLRHFSNNVFISQTMLSGASGYPAGSHALGGKITPLIRANLILKAGKDDNGQMTWQLNEKQVDRQTLKDILDELKV